MRAASTCHRTGMLIRLGRLPFGITHDLVRNDGEPYLERWILWFGFSLRVHRFFTSDKDRAPHDHPWWFVTLPFSTYGEYYTAEGEEKYRLVKPWRLHYRSPQFRHRVEIQSAPSWTIVLTGTKSKEWGFWESDEEFVHNEDWLRPD